MKYKVGDKVRVKSDLYDGGMYGCCDLNEEMESYRGKIVTISLVGRDCYEIEEDDTSYSWTDEMFEPVEEMSAEEALKICGEICGSFSTCNTCPLYTLDAGIDVEHLEECFESIARNTEKAIEILKQWKADHEKKPIETEFAWYVQIIEADTHTLKHEEKVETDIKSMDAQKAEILKKYCSEHDGKYYAISERRCVVKG